MRGHEGCEVRKLYPYISQRWGVSFEEAELGQEDLAVPDRPVRAAPLLNLAAVIVDDPSLLVGFDHQLVSVPAA